MLQVLSSAWALLLGMCLLMVGNGMQGTLLGIKGQYLIFDTGVINLRKYGGYDLTLKQTN